MEPHGVPALLSFFFPGLGQLVKGQWPRFVGIWLIITFVWAIYGAARVLVFAPVIPQGLEIALMAVPAFATLVVWLWGVVDAYRTPSA